MNRSAKGSRFENAVVAHLEGMGWTYVTRASNSKGVADVVAISPSATLMIECKTDGRCDPEQWNGLVEVARMCRAVPVLAEPIDRREEPGMPPVRYWEMTDVKGAGKRQPRIEIFPEWYRA